MSNRRNFGLVEAGESRTLRQIDRTISKGVPRLPYKDISDILELNIRQVYSMFDLEVDPTTLLPLLLNQLIALGQTAQQFKQDLGKNVYYPDCIAKTEIQFEHLTFNQI